MTKLLGKITYFSILVFTFFVFFDLNWGAPFYFHPDERNIASAVTRLDITESLNPEFFAYGGLPIYSIYFVGLANNFLQDPFSFSDFTISFEEAVVISRIFSSILTILTVFLIYKLAIKIAGESVARLAVLLSTLSVGYLQYSHFGTFEIWLSFFYLLLLYMMITFLKRRDIRTLLITGVVFGSCVSIKISSLSLVIFPLLAISVVSFKGASLEKIVKSCIKYFLIFFYAATAIFLITNPFVILDFESFMHSMNYETSVATGLLRVFYTGSFINTVPIVFQMVKVLPFLINPIMTVILIPALIYASHTAIKRRDAGLILLVLFFAFFFVSQSILYVKWTRYIVPGISLIYILNAIFFLETKRIIPKKIWMTTLLMVITFSSLFTISFLKTVRIAPDTRIDAAGFAEKNIDENARIVSEVFDLGIVPFNDSLHNIELFDFYDLETGAHAVSFSSAIDSTEYLILPSQRLFKSRIENSDAFPLGSDFYNKLAEEKDFSLIYKTPCDIFCRILYLGDPIFNVEETVNIFDRPIVQIYKNEKSN